MSESVNKLKDIALVGHGGAGKTSLAESILFDAGVTNRLGSVDDGNSVMDFEPEEVQRHISISAAFHHYAWKKHTVNIIDTPGDANFFSDTRSCLQVADGSIVVIAATDGVKVQTEQAWEFADQLEMPRGVFVNKMDRDRADFLGTIKDVAGAFTPKPILLQLPIGAEEDFRGVVDLISQKAYLYEEDGKSKVMDVPVEMQDQVASERDALIENIAEADDALLEKYLDGNPLTDEDLKQGLRAGTLNRTFVPVLCGSATRNIGIDRLMDFINDCLPSPVDRGPKIGIDPDTGERLELRPAIDEPFSALVFKTIADPYAGRLSIFRVYSGTVAPDGSFYNTTKGTKERYGQIFRMAGREQVGVAQAGPGDILAVAKLKETTTGDTLCEESKKIRFESIEPLPSLMSYAIEPKSKKDEDKVFISLSRLLEEDPTLRLNRDPETRQILISGMGQIHLETMVEKLRRKFGIEVNLKSPKIPYRETIKQSVKGVVYRHKKQSGGRGQFAEVHFDISPLEEGKGFEFEEALTGMNVPRNFVPAVEKGLVEAMHSGVLAGYPVVDVTVRFYDGKSHDVDSSEMAFKIAASMCFKKGFQDAKPTLLEPIMNLAVTVPEDYMGDVIGDLNGRRGKVMGVDAAGKKQLIRAQVPMAEILNYAPALTSMTGGRGTFVAEPDHYEDVPAQIIQKIIEQAESVK
ncbi:MAG: translation elongation factor G [Desulfobacterales bacterium C00003060]|nr:MAG: translation elongation factor G [Desulfobacterales bacterium S3730MH5]OEU77601.1 MAG: translation elongation factor G [Desulfobacterales bacterium C00003060]OEU82528.1 MAG: translation elongation factor G [Desulfobacterales bacterium S5133MH4]